MYPLRNLIPSRRIKPTRRPKTDWSLHKDDLQEDFNSSCAYCDAHDHFKHTFYEVDHFIPKDFFIKNGNITLAQYSNLVYSCKFCNNFKKDKWPSQSEDIFFIDDQGFVDPCNPDYDTHFHRTSEGAIVGSTNLGKWMAKQAFKFDEREHAIKLLWTLKNLNNTLTQLKLKLNECAPESEDYIMIHNKMKEYALEYYYFHSELVANYNS